MDKQFKRLLELARKKDEGTISKREEVKLDKLTYRHITKCHEEIKVYQARLIELNNQLLTNAFMMSEANKALNQTFQFLKDKGLFEEFKALNEQNL